jgi:hypothetical protein
MELREVGWDNEDWIHLAQDRNTWWAVLNTLVKVWFP